jgi:hypothetical protein
MKIVQFAEEHPWEAGGIVFAGGLFLLWILGFFSKAPASGGGDGGLAAAYYQASMAQTVAGTQLQIAQANGVAQTAQAQIAADAATKINAQNTAAATAITQTNATAATDISATQASTIKAVNKQNADAAVSINKTNAATSLSQTMANAYSNLLSIIVPQEMAMNGGSAAVSIPFFGGGNVAVSAGLTTGPDTLAQMGFNPQQIASYFHDTSFGSGTP